MAFGNLRTLRWCGRLSAIKCLLYSFCSSVPDFVVSLPSVLASQLTTLRRTNDSDFQSAHKGLAPSGKITRCRICFLIRNLYFRIFIKAYSVCPAHAGHTHRFGKSGAKVLKSTFVLLLNFCILSETFGFDCPAFAKPFPVTKFLPTSIILVCNIFFCIFVLSERKHVEKQSNKHRYQIVT